MLSSRAAEPQRASLSLRPQFWIAKILIRILKSFAVFAVAAADHLQPEVLVTANRSKNAQKVDLKGARGPPKLSNEIEAKTIIRVFFSWLRRLQTAGSRAFSSGFPGSRPASRASYNWAPSIIPGKEALRPNLTKSAGLRIGRSARGQRHTPGVVSIEPVAVGALTHPGILA